MDAMDHQRTDHAGSARRLDSQVANRMGGGRRLFLRHFRNGEVVGSSGLHRRGARDSVEIGYWIHVDHLRQGYATEAANALTQAAFATPSIARVEIRHDKANTASAGVPERLGFTFVGETSDEITAPAEVGIEVRWVSYRPNA